MLYVLTVKTDKENENENVIQIPALPPANCHAAFIDATTLFSV